MKDEREVKININVRVIGCYCKSGRTDRPMLLPL